MVKKMSIQRIVMQVLLQSGQTVCMVAWLFYGQQWAANISKFMLAISLVAAIPILFSEDAKKRLRKMGVALPLWLQGFADTLLIVGLVAFGHWIWATALLIHVIAFVAALDEDEALSTGPAIT